MVVVVGMGFAGRMAALRIRAAGFEVMAIDAAARATERTRLHEAAARGRDVSIPLEAWLQRIGASFRLGRVVGLEPGRVFLEDGAEIRCEQIVVAAGSGVDDRSVPGVWEHACHLGTAESAAALHRSLPGARHAAVIGAGLTGIELATELAEAHPELKVRLVGGLTGWSPKGEQIVREALAANRIEWTEATVKAVTPAGVETDRGFLEADRVIWAAGLKAPDWLARAGLPVDERGRVRVDPTLAVMGMDGIVVAGDCASTPLRMACATAMPLGCHAAQTVVRTLRGQQPEPFSFSYMLRCVSLGRKRALLQGTDRNDAPTWALGGRGAVFVKESILRAAASVHTLEASTGLSLYGWRGNADTEKISAWGTA